MAKKPTNKIVVKEAAQTKPNPAPASATNEKFSLTVKLALLLGIISLFVYANTLKNGYALDDYNVIVNNTYIAKGMSAIPQILSTPYRWGNVTSANDLYRPLSLVMFAAEYQFFGKNPLPNHLVNILLFAGCVILLFFFLNALFERKKTAVAFIAAVLFALHPIHTEVVANIKSRDELLCFFFSFLSLNIFIKYMQSGKIAQLLLGFLCFLLAFLSKETVVTFVAIVPLIFFFYRNEDKKRAIYITASTILASIICIATRVTVLNFYHANNAASIDFMDNIMAAKDLPLAMHLATAFYTLGLYIKLLLAPYPLICDYSYNSIPLVSFSNVVVLISLLFYLFLAGFSIRQFLKNKRDPYAFGIFFFLITIALFSNIPFLIGTTMGERLVFFPSVGFCLVVALLIEMWVGSNGKTALQIIKSPKTLGIIIPVSLAYAYITFDRNSEWLDNYTLYSADVKKAPEDARLYFYLGTELVSNMVPEEKDPAQQKKMREESIGYLRKSVEIHPEFADAQATLAETYYNNSQYDSAEQHAKLALKYIPNYFNAFFTLAGVYIAEKKYLESIEVLKKMLQTNPDDENTHVRIGDAYLYSGQYDSSEVHDKRALQINPKSTDAMNNLAGVYFYNKKYAQAIDVYKKAINIRPDFVDPYTNIAACYLYLVKYDSAVYYLNRARSINPNNNAVYEILAATYKAAGNLDSARKYESIAQRNNPGFKL